MPTFYHGTGVRKAAASLGTNQDSGNQLANEGFARTSQNDAQEGQVNSGTAWANGQAAGAQNRGPQAVEDRTLANREASGADGNQAGAMQLARQMAMGQAPSEAAYQLQAGLDRGIGQQQAMGRSARGAAALSTAGANSQANQATMQQNAYTQGGLLRSKDMAAGRGMYATLSGQQREQDLNRLGAGNEMGQFNAKLNDAYGMQMGNAAIGLGEAGNALNGRDLNNFERGTRAIGAQDQANQQSKLWELQKRQQEQAAYLEDE